MIVTCPSCSSKFRVRNEDLGSEGVELKCPNCSQRFLALPPDKPAEPNLAQRLDALKKGHDAAIARSKDLEKVAGALRDELRQAKAQNAELQSQKEAAERGAAQVGKLNSALLKSQRTAQTLINERDTLKQELEKASIRATHLQSTPAPLQSAPSEVLEVEVESLRRENANLRAGNMSQPLKNALDSVRPLSWGLEQTITYIEPFAKTEQTLAQHLKQLRMLRTLLKRLEDLLPNA